MAVLAISGPGQFAVKQTQISLPHLYLLQVDEAVPRIALYSPPPSRINISFPSKILSQSVWDGVEVGAGELILHGREGGAHNRTTGPVSWGHISFEKAALVAYAESVAGTCITSPKTSLVLRPSKSIAMRLVRLHRKACRLAALKPAMFVHAEVMRALENELLEVLLPCLPSGDAYGKRTGAVKRVKAMERFEAAITAKIASPFSVPAFCREISIPQRTLRGYCSEVLGLSPNQYVRLRRLNSIRAALQHRDPSTTSVEAVARHYQFRQIGRFAVTYRELFGESPSITLRGRASKTRVPSSSAEFA